MAGVHCARVYRPRILPARAALVLVARAPACRHGKGTAVSRALIFTPQSRGTPHRPRSMHSRGQRYGYVFMVASRHAPRAKRILTAHHKNASSAGCAVRGPRRGVLQGRPRAMCASAPPSSGARLEPPVPPRARLAAPDQTWTSATSALRDLIRFPLRKKKLNEPNFTLMLTCETSSSERPSPVAYVVDA